MYISLSKYTCTHAHVQLLSLRMRKVVPKRVCAHLLEFNHFGIQYSWHRLVMKGHDAINSIILYGPECNL